MKKTLEEKVRAIAEKVDGRVYEGYSGRCMFGARCWGVTCSGYAVKETISLGNRARLGTARTDNMGLDMIVYWPDAK